MLATKVRRRLPVGAEVARGGTPPLETRYNWIVPGHSAVAMRPAPAGETFDPARGGDQMSEEEETRTEALRGLDE